MRRSNTGSDGRFLQSDEITATSDEPGYQNLCDRKQTCFLKACREDLDLSDHLNDAINSLRIVLAADRSVRTEQVIKLAQ